MTPDYKETTVGAEPWYYFVPYEDNLQNALENLRQQEFAAGNFYPSERRPKTIERAIEMADADGTKSILDMHRVGDSADCGVVYRLPPDEVAEIFGTEKPDRSVVDAKKWDLYSEINRGEGVCAVIYKDDQPSEIFFGGYSYD
jgi:hypothetical protein